MFKKGDKIYLWNVGYDVVGEIVPSLYPVCCAGRAFTQEGRENISDDFPKLFHAIPSLIIPSEPERRPDLAMDTPIIVWDLNENNILKRHFKCWGKSGSVHCWSDGRTKFTASELFEDKLNFKRWKNWRLPEKGDCE